MASASGTEDVSEVDEPKSTASKGEKPAPKKRRAYDEDDDEVPVFGGRLMWAVGLIAVTSILPMSKFGEVLEPRGPTPTDVGAWGVGVKSTVRITLVTADYDLLACASTQEFEGVHCAYKNTDTPWPRDPGEADNNKLNVVQPYRTWFDNKLVFVAGLWNQPAAAYRLHSEPPAGQDPDKLARFAVECRVKFVGKFDSAKLRWKPSQSWNDPDGPAWVGKAEFCKLIDEPD